MASKRLNTGGNFRSHGTSWGEWLQCFLNFPQTTSLWWNQSWWWEILCIPNLESCFISHIFAQVGVLFYRFMFKRKTVFDFKKNFKTIIQTKIGQRSIFSIKKSHGTTPTPSRNTTERLRRWLVGLLGRIPKNNAGNWWLQNQVFSYGSPSLATW